jgi:hypothetical protein
VGIFVRKYFRSLLFLQQNEKSADFYSSALLLLKGLQICSSLSANIISYYSIVDQEAASPDYTSSPTHCSVSSLHQYLSRRPSYSYRDFDHFPYKNTPFNLMSVRRGDSIPLCKASSNALGHCGRRGQRAGCRVQGCRLCRRTPDVLLRFLYRFR